MGFGTQAIFALIAAVVALHYSGRLKFILDSVNKTIIGARGCVPAPAIEELTLQYFRVRGRAESIRMILQDNNVPYSEVNFGGEEWTEIKRKGFESGTFTFGQVPAITTRSGFSLVQSMAIVHYIGRSLGMDCECDEYHLCEVIALGSEDLRAKHGKVVYDPNFSMASRNAYLTDVLPVWLGYFERLAPEIEKESNDSFFIGDRLTWIDYVMFELLDMCIEFTVGTKPYLNGLDVSEHVLDNFPKLKNFYETFYQRPQLKKYLLSPDRIPFKLPYPPEPAVNSTPS